MRRHAEGRQTVEDRPIEAYAPRRLGIGMERIVIARQAIDQRLLRHRRQRYRAVGRALGQRMGRLLRSEEHTSEVQSLMRISYAVFCLKKKTAQQTEGL